MNDLDTLMHRMEEINEIAAVDLLPADIDTIIAYNRAMRQRRAAGEKPTKPTEAKANLSDIAKNLLGKSTAGTAKINRRI